MTAMADEPTRVVDRYEWRYTVDGKVTHALTSPRECVSECGIGPWTYDQWRGTGSQLEYETAAALPKCRRCLRKIGAPGG
jgi:hypothetical protein